MTNNNNNNSLSIENQQKLEEIKINLSWIGSLLLSRSGILSVISSLGVALLVVFSLDKRLIPLSDEELKVLMTVLLFVIPVSLIHYLIEINIAINKTVKRTEKILGGRIFDSSKGLKGITKEILSSLVVHVPSVMLCLVIFYVMYGIWR